MGTKESKGRRRKIMLKGFAAMEVLALFLKASENGMNREQPN